MVLILRKFKNVEGYVLKKNRAGKNSWMRDPNYINPRKKEALQQLESLKDDNLYSYDCIISEYSDYDVLNKFTEELVESLFYDSNNGFPKVVDGKNTLNKMKLTEEHTGVNTNWKQIEWAGFYIESIFKELNNSDNFQYPSPTIVNNTIFDGEYFEIDNNTSHILDIKTHDINSSGNIIMMNDKKAVDKVLDQNDSMFVIIVNIDAQKDEDGSFKKYSDELKKSIGHKSRSLPDSKNKRKMKKSFFTQDIQILLINNDNKNEILDQTTQGRNSNGEERPDKYNIVINNIEEYSTKIKLL